MTKLGVGNRHVIALFLHLSKRADLASSHGFCFTWIHAPWRLRGSTARALPRPSWWSPRAGHARGGPDATLPGAVVPGGHAGVLGAPGLPRLAAGGPWRDLSLLSGSLPLSGHS